MCFANCLERRFHKAVQHKLSRRRPRLPALGLCTFLTFRGACNFYVRGGQTKKPDQLQKATRKDSHSEFRIYHCVHGPEDDSLQCAICDICSVCITSSVSSSNTRTLFRHDARDVALGHWRNMSEIIRICALTTFADTVVVLIAQGPAGSRCQRRCSGGRRQRHVGCRRRLGDGQPGRRRGCCRSR